jgi:hypothetical protein
VRIEATGGSTIVTSYARRTIRLPLALTDTLPRPHVDTERRYPVDIRDIITVVTLRNTPLDCLVGGVGRRHRPAWSARDAVDDVSAPPSSISSLGDRISNSYRTFT